MASPRTKLVIGGVLLLAAGAYLVRAGMASGAWTYYVEVDQLAAGRLPPERVRLHGRVGEGADIRRAELCANFDLRGASASVPVVLHGAIPELFREGQDVVVEGRFDEHGTFISDLVLAKCASKYEGRTAGHPRELPR